MMKDYKTKDMKATKDQPESLVCVRECVTPGLGNGTWAPGDKVSDPVLVKALGGNPYFKSSSEVK